MESDDAYISGENTNLLQSAISQMEDRKEAMIEEVDSEEIKDDDPSDESFKKLFIPDLRRPKHDC